MTSRLTGLLAPFALIAPLALASVSALAREPGSPRGVIVENPFGCQDIAGVGTQGRNQGLPGRAGPAQRILQMSKVRSTVEPEYQKQVSSEARITIQTQPDCFGALKSVHYSSTKRLAASPVRTFLRIFPVGFRGRSLVPISHWEGTLK